MADMHFLRTFTATLKHEPAAAVVPAQRPAGFYAVALTAVAALDDERFSDAHLNDCNDPECECWVRSLA